MYKGLICLVINILFFAKGIAQISYLLPDKKQTFVSAAVEKIFKSGNNKVQEFIISPYSGSLINKLDAENIPNKIIDSASRTLIVRCLPASLHKLLKEKTTIQFVNILPKAKEEIGIVGYNRSFHGINLLQEFLPQANGKNITIGIKERTPEARDLDLYKRVLTSSLAHKETEMHATIIASIIGGAGNSYYDGTGIATASQFFPSSYERLFPDDISVLNSQNISVQNHAYGTVIQSFYGPEALSYDEQLFKHKYLLHVFSAGNQGVAAAEDGAYKGIPGFANITGNFKMAKNVITVGAVNNSEDISPNSSSGPTYDGRIAPQIMALGPNGTSDASGMVSGTIAVLQQIYKDSNNGILPDASLVKALLFGTTDSLNKGKISYKTGYGLLNSYNAVTTLQKKQYFIATIKNAENKEFKVFIPSGIDEVKVTLNWTDTTASLNNTKALVNDLDIVLKNDATGSSFLPWVLLSDPDKIKHSLAPTRGRDTLNTTEQISIFRPASGWYSIIVKAGNNFQSEIPFSVVYKMDTINTLRIENPLNTKDVNREENPELKIKWRVSLLNKSEKGTIFISYNRGKDWELIAENIPLQKKSFTWQIKDTLAEGLIKIATPFGEFYSGSFYLQPVTRIKVDYNCTDSARISWNTTPFATGYRIYSLGDSPYLLPILETQNNTYTIKKNQPHLTVYAVEPITPFKSIRSIATDFTQQGQKCFYNTFYYYPVDEKKYNLIVKQNFFDETDKVVFEKLNNQREFYSIIKEVSNSDDDGSFVTEVTDLTKGLNFYRAKIILKNGSVFFTEVISILSTGQNKILFYPNPVRIGELLKLQLQQNLSGDCKLEFFDAAGRVIKKYNTIPNEIRFNKQAGTVIFWKLKNEQNLTIDAGKIILQP